MSLMASSCSQWPILLHSKPIPGTAIALPPIKNLHDCKAHMYCGGQMAAMGTEHDIYNMMS